MDEDKLRRLFYALDALAVEELSAVPGRLRIDLIDIEGEAAQMIQLMHEGASEEAPDLEQILVDVSLSAKHLVKHLNSLLSLRYASD
jgi:hypothetical protein